MHNRSLKNFVEKAFSFVVCIAVLSGAFSVHAQKRAGKTATNKTSAPTKAAANKPSSQNCNGGWSGFVTYTKTLNETTNQISGKTTHKGSRNYKYSGRIAVDGSQNPKILQTKAQVSLTDDIKYFKRFVQIDACHYDGKGQREQWSETTDNRLTNAFGEGEALFWFSVDELRGNYSFSFRFPEAAGVENRESKVVSGGWCQPDNNRNDDYPTTSRAKIDGYGTEISDQKIDQKNPDVLSGSKTWDTSSDTLKSFKYTVTWSFRRCPAPLELEAVEFDEYRYPKWGEWHKVDGETIDGNRVRVRARVTNYSSETKFPQLKFIETKANVELPDSETNISIAPGESREVEYLWDTSGWAWETGGIPASERSVKVEMTEPTSPAKTLTEDVLIIPRPVILAHGLWADHTSWNGYDTFFKQAHSSSWSSYAVGANPDEGVMNTGEKGSWKKSNSIGQNADQLKKQIEAVCRNKNAWHVDIVAHSMGGLIARYYISVIMDIMPTGMPTVTRLVQLGTPNEGSPCAYLADFTFWTLGKQTRAIQDLLPVRMEKFNQQYRNRRGTRFSVLVGNSVPQTCQSNIWGDGVVEIPSAIWEIKDHRYSRSIHTNLTSRENFEYFVWRRLAVSWRGNHKPDTDYQANYENGNSNAVQFFKASFSDDEKPVLPENLKVDLAKEVSLKPKQTTEIEIPVSKNSGVMFIAAPTVSATLINDKGAVAAKNLAGTPESETDFRSLPVENGANETWKIKFENTSTSETSAIVAVWTDSNVTRTRLTVEAGKPTANGQIPLTAKLSENNSPVSGASVKTQIINDDGKFFTIELFDDGAHGDGAAGDGVYGATTEKLADGAYSVTAKAEINGQMFVAAETFDIGSTPKVSTARKVKK